MTFVKPIYFQTVTCAYNAETGDYGDEKITEVKRYASITNSGTDTINLVYGELKQGSLIVRLQNHYNAPFNRIRIDEKLYRVDMQRRLLNKHVFVISEVQ